MEQSIYRMQYSVGILKDNSDALIEEIEQSAMKIKNLAEYESLKNRLYVQRIEMGVLRLDDDSPLLLLSSGSATHLCHELKTSFV